MENTRRIRESIVESAEKVVEMYGKEMQSLLNSKVWITKEEFKRLEKEIHNKTIYYCQNNYSFDSNTNENFVLKVNNDLIKSKDVFKGKNKTKSNKVIENTENSLKTAFEMYGKGMVEMKDFINSEENLQKRHQNVYQKVRNEFNKCCVFKDQEFLKPYLERLELQINSSYEKYLKEMNEKRERINNRFMSAMNEAKSHYTNVLIVIKLFFDSIFFKIIFDFGGNERNSGLGL